MSKPKNALHANELLQKVINRNQFMMVPSLYFKVYLCHRQNNILLKYAFQLTLSEFSISLLKLPRS